VYKFYIPLQKGIELRPYQNYPVPVVRTTVHSEELLRSNQLAQISAKVDDILARNAGVIQHWCNARRQEYSLSNNKFEKKSYELDRLTLTHTILFNQEIIEIDVYPSAVAKREDDLKCLMVIANDTIYALPMDKLNQPQELEIIYEKTFDPLGLEDYILTQRQYKFVGADIGFFLGDFDFSKTKLAEAVEAYSRMTPIDDEVEYSALIDAYFNGAVNGVGQDIYFLDGVYRYSSRKVEKIESFDLIGYPYAIDSSKTRYFGEGVKRWNASFGELPLFSLYQLSSQMQDQLDSYLASLTSTSVPIFLSTYGTAPDGNLQLKVADFNFETRRSNSTDVSMTPALPVFSTGDGDRIDLVPFSVGASNSTVEEILEGATNEEVLNRAKTDGNAMEDPAWQGYIFFGDGTEAWRLGATTTEITLSFDKVNESVSDFRISSGGGANFPSISVTTNPFFPTLEHPIYYLRKYTFEVYPGLPDTTYPENYSLPRGQNSQKMGLYWSFMPEKENLSVEEGVSPLLHISNGKDYIQAAVVGSYDNYTRVVFCNGVNIASKLEELGILNFNMMAMDIPLKRIKKFT
jgi:hypothetical protein